MNQWKVPYGKLSFFSRRTQNHVSEAGFGNGLIHKKKRNLCLHCTYEAHSEKAENPKKMLEFWIWFIFTTLGRGFNSVGCHGPFLSFFFFSSILSSLLIINSGEGKRKRKKLWWILPPRQEEDFTWEERPTIYKLCINSKQHKVSGNPRETEKAPLVTLIFWFYFSMNVT